ncbi:MAG TPA: methyltransferase domain-containing protein [Candidatus Acidoferrum sp.]|jgi:SAM-dependent methyltransferase|nr:methyltransferase domain-containing protein [Candidatus Acidoferrum sp.]
MDSTTRFSKRAEDYARYRPSYPSDAIAAILDGFTKPRVADLGAGTGISSILLANAGARVYAIEPNAAMRAAIPLRPDIELIDGTAESTNLRDRSVDVVTAFQAYHWFDHDLVLTEAERIGRRRVRFAAVWNERDETDPFMLAYSDIIRRYMADDTESRRRATTVDGDLRDRGWTDVRVLDFRHAMPIDWDGLIGRTRSASYLPREGPAYETMAAELRALYDRAGELGGARFVLTTAVHLGERQ